MNLELPSKLRSLSPPLPLSLFFWNNLACISVHDSIHYWATCWIKQYWTHPSLSITLSRNDNIIDVAGPISPKRRLGNDWSSETPREKERERGKADAGNYLSRGEPHLSQQFFQRVPPRRRFARQARGSPMSPRLKRGAHSRTTVSRVWVRRRRLREPSSRPSTAEEREMRASSPSRRSPRGGGWSGRRIRSAGGTAPSCLPPLSSRVPLLVPPPRTPSERLSVEEIARPRSSHFRRGSHVKRAATTTPSTCSVSKGRDYRVFFFCNWLKTIDCLN